MGLLEHHGLLLLFQPLGALLLIQEVGIAPSKIMHVHNCRFLLLGENVGTRYEVQSIPKGGLCSHGCQYSLCIGHQGDILLLTSTMQPLAFPIMTQVPRCTLL